MAVTGKTGADAIFGALRHVCHVLTKYNTKLLAVITAAQLAGAITADEAATCRAFIAVAVLTCDAFGKLADYSGFG